MLNQIEKLTEQLRDENIKLPLLLRIQKLNVLRKLLFDTGRVEESDQVTMQRIKSHAWKEVQKDKEETKRAVNNAREITERQKSSDSRKETYITLITVIVLAIIGAAMCLFKII